MRPEKIFIVGNCTVDLVFRGKILEERIDGERLALALGGKYVADELYQCYGGGGANAAVSLARQDFAVHLWARLGNDAFGKEVLINLEKERVETSLIDFEAERTPVSAILLTVDGRRTIVTYRSNTDLLKLNQRVGQTMKDCRWLALFSLANCPKEDKLTILKEAKKYGLKIFLSLHGTEYYKGYDYLKDYLEYCDILQLNAHELANIFNKKHAEELNLAHDNFSQKLKIPMLVLGNDIHGGYVYTKDKIVYQPAIEPKIRVDTTGAGDALAAGFLGAYIKTNNVEKSLLFGTQNAVAKMEKLGAQAGLLRTK